MAEATKYRLNNQAGPFPQGTLLTRAQIEKAGCDFDFWESTNTISEASPRDTQVDGFDKVLDDAALSATIENRIREEGATDPRRQDAIAAQTRAEWDELKAERADDQIEDLTRRAKEHGGDRKPPASSDKFPQRVGVPQVGGRPLTDYDGKSDDEIRKMVGGNADGKNAFLREVRDAQRVAKAANPGAHNPGGGGSTNPNQ